MLNGAIMIKMTKTSIVVFTNLPTSCFLRKQENLWSFDDERKSLFEKKRTVKKFIILH